MDALVATFRILYDPAKRLEYNAKSNKSGKSPTGVIPSPPPTGLQKSVSDEDKSSCTSSSVQHKSNTRRRMRYRTKIKREVAAVVSELPSEVVSEDRSPNRKKYIVLPCRARRTSRSLMRTSSIRISPLTTILATLHFARPMNK